MTASIQTPRGAEAQRQERAMIRAFAESHGRYFLMETPTDPTLFPCADALIGSVATGECVMLLEAKARPFFGSLRRFREEFNGEWLISTSKIDRAREVATRLAVPLFGLMGIPQDGIALLKEITNAHGEWMTPFARRSLLTSKTINGGQHEDECYFFPMADANPYSLKW